MIFGFAFHTLLVVPGTTKRGEPKSGEPIDGFWGNHDFQARRRRIFLSNDGVFFR